MSPTTILVIDDHPLFRSGLSMVLRPDIANAQVLEASRVGCACAPSQPVRKRTLRSYIAGTAER